MPMTARVQEWADMKTTRWSSTFHDVLAQSLLSWSDLLGSRGPLPDRIHAITPITIDTDPALADAILAGRYVFGSDVVDIDTPQNPWLIEGPSNGWMEALHGFSWLTHFQILDDEEAREEARARVDHWMTEKGRWDPVSWRPQVTARRLISWFNHAPMILTGADLVWRSSFLRNVARQAVHLARTAAWAPEGLPRMTAAIGLAMSGVSLPHGESRREKGLEMLVAELEKQILPDGGHVSRSPEALLRVLIDLINLKSVMDKQRVDLPEPILHALDRMFPMVRFFRHGDGSLAYFNGAAAIETDLIDDILAQDETGGSPVSQANPSGFQRLAQGETTIVMDTGTPPPSAIGAESHAGCLSFELSHGLHRIIVNCGATHTHGPDWRAVMRSTAAHSTITIDDTSSCHFYPVDPSSDYEDGRVLSGPRDVTRDRRETGEGSSLQASHDGYLKRFGVRHMRRLSLNDIGEILEGEDILSTDGGRSALGRAKSKPFAVRFHLHPDVEAKVLDGNKGILLTLSDGTHWRFVADGGGLCLSETIFVGHGARIRPAQQIVVQSMIDGPETVIRWTLQQVAPDLRAGFGVPRKEEPSLQVPSRKQEEVGAMVLQPVAPRLPRRGERAAPLPEPQTVAEAPDNPMRRFVDEELSAKDGDFAGQDDEWPPISVDDVKTLEPAD